MLNLFPKDFGFSRELGVKHLTQWTRGFDQIKSRLPLLEAPSGSAQNPWVAAALSGLFGGTGQIYLGQTKKGAVIIVVSLVGLGALVLPGLVVIGFGVYDAYVIGRRLQDRGTVGNWECFWHTPAEIHWSVSRIESNGLSEQFVGVETFRVDNAQGDAAVTRSLRIRKEWSQSYVVEQEKVQSTVMEFDPKLIESVMVKRTVENLFREKYSYSSCKTQAMEEDVVIEVPPRKSICIELHWKNILAGWTVVLGNQYRQEVAIPVSLVTKLSFDQKILEAR